MPSDQIDLGPTFFGAVMMQYCDLIIRRCLLWHHNIIGSQHQKRSLRFGARQSPRPYGLPITSGPLHIASPK